MYHRAHWNVVLDALAFLCLRSTGVWLQWPEIILCDIRGLAFLTPSGARATFGVLWVVYRNTYASSIMLRVLSHGNTTFIAV